MTERLIAGARVVKLLGVDISGLDPATSVALTEAVLAQAGPLTATLAPAPATSPNSGDCGPMGFGAALTALKAGARVTRTGWNGRDMWLILIPGSTITVEAGRPLGQAAPHMIGRRFDYQAHIDIKTAQGTLVPYLASQSDLLAEDWEVLTTVYAWGGGTPTDPWGSALSTTEHEN